jgi:hypothetical protein
MRRTFFTLAIIAAVSPAAYAQSTANPQPSGGSNSIVRVPPSTGAISGSSGSVAPATPYYPAPLRNLNNPAASYGGRYIPPNAGVNRR